MPQWPSLHLPAAATAARRASSFALCRSFSSSSPASVSASASNHGSAAPCPSQEEDEQPLVVWWWAEAPPPGRTPRQVPRPCLPTSHQRGGPRERKVLVQATAIFFIKRLHSTERLRQFRSLICMHWHCLLIGSHFQRS
ncbi:hypothetical protein ABZP36_011319 [Zizania latifolia]